MIKISSFIIGMVLMVFVVTGLTLFMADVNEKYPVSNYDNNSLESFNRLNELNELSENVYNKTSITSDSNLFDQAGFYLSAGYSASKTATTSFSIFNDMAQDTAEISGVKHSELILPVLITIVLLSLTFLIIGIMVRSHV